MKRIMASLLLITLCFALAACSKTAEKKKVLIYSSAEEYRNEYLARRLAEQFPDYEIKIEYLSSGTHATKLLAEGKDTPCDISFDLEYGSAAKLQDNFADLSAYDLSAFTDDMILPGNKVMPEIRNGGCIAINPKVLAEKGLPKPASYQDLLNPQYKGLISMPDPTSSGTGYMFVKSLVNVWGEEAAFAYFAALTDNIKQYTASGSGPVNALVMGEAGIGLAMTAQAVTEINNKVDLEILFFEEGSPFSCYGYAMIEGKQSRPEVKAVFDFLYNTLNKENVAKFYPEKVYKAEDFVIENYPANIRYADMSGNTADEKTRLQERWKNQ